MLTCSLYVMMQQRQCHSLAEHLPMASPRQACMGQAAKGNDRCIALQGTGSSVDIRLVCDMNPEAAMAEALSRRAGLGRLTTCMVGTGS